MAPSTCCPRIGGQHVVRTVPMCLDYRASNRLPRFSHFERGVALSCGATERVMETTPVKQQELCLATAGMWKRLTE